MSYVLHIWETPVPATLAGAARAAMDMGADAVGQNPGFLVLAGRLTSRYPCLSTAPADSVWSDAPLDGKTDERTWAIGIRSDHEQVVDFVVRQANALRLCVFDMQQGMAWLPDGTVFRPSGPAVVGLPLAALAGNDTRLTRAAAHGGLRRLLGKVFGPLGYAPRDSIDGLGCRLALPDGHIDVGVAVRDRYSSISFSFFCTVRHARCADIVDIFDDTEPQYRGTRWCGFVNQDELHPDGLDEIEVDGPRRLDIELDSLDTVLRERVVPLLMQCRTLAGMERHANRPWISKSARHDRHYMSDIVLAWLVGNPKWERIAADCLGALHYRAVYLRLRIERLVAWLRVVDPAGPLILPRSRSEGNLDLIRSYDGSQRGEFACVSVGSRETADYADGNELYRKGLIRDTLTADDAPLDLLRDLFSEELVCWHGNKQEGGGYALAMRLLERGGAGEVALVVQGLTAAHIHNWLQHDNYFLPDNACELAAECTRRAHGAPDPATGEAYAMLARVLGRRAASRA